VQQDRLEALGIEFHFAGGDLSVARALEAQFANSQIAGFAAHRRTEDAAGDGTSRIQIARQRFGIERGAGCIIRHGRLEGGKVHFATLEVEPPDPVRVEDRQVRVFVRPHDLEIETQRNGHPAFPAVIKRVHSAGPNVRLELRTEGGELLQAEMPQDRYRTLGVRVESRVYVSPRTVKVFGPEKDGFAHGDGI